MTDPPSARLAIGVASEAVPVYLAEMTTVGRGAPPEPSLEKKQQRPDMIGSLVY